MSNIVSDVGTSFVVDDHECWTKFLLYVYRLYIDSLYETPNRMTCAIYLF